MIAQLQTVLNLLTSAERRAALMLTGLMLIGMVFEALGVGLVIPAIVLMTRPGIEVDFPVLGDVIQRLGPLTQVQLIQLVMLSLVVFFFIKNIYIGLLSWRQTSFTTSVQAQMSQRLFAMYMAQPYAFHLQRNSAQLIRNVNSEVAMFSEALANLLFMLTEALAVTGIAVLLMIVEPAGTLLVASVLGVAAWTLHFLTRHRLARWGAERQHHDGMKLQHLQQGLGGVKDVKLLGREGEFLSEFRRHNVQGARINRLRSTVASFPRLWLEWLAVLGLAVLVLVMLAQGRAVEQVLPTVGLFAAAAFRLMPSFNRILGGMQSLRYYWPAVNTLNQEVQIGKGSADKAVENREPGFKLQFLSELTVVNVSYEYAGGRSPALQNVTLQARAGESIGLVGSSGSGKSTLVDIILGLLEPDSGEVCVDGVSIQQNLRGWQDKIGYVPQSIYLTDDTLARNIAFGLPDDKIDPNAVRRALAAAQLEDFVAHLPQGLSTRVGERGVRLSGGQRQRIGIARALYHDPDVLVLDEATSSLDISTEQGIMQAVMSLRGKKTVLIVAHRLSTVEHCDRLYKLDNGRLVAQGAPREVLSMLRAG